MIIRTKLPIGLMKVEVGSGIVAHYTIHRVEHGGRLYCNEVIYPATIELLDGNTVDGYSLTQTFPAFMRGDIKELHQVLVDPDKFTVWNAKTGELVLGRGRKGAKA